MNHKFADYNELSKLVNENESVLTVTMGQLRDAHGAGKLGTTVVAGIHDRLESLGLGHMPPELSTTQWHTALLYRKGTAVARIVEAVNNIGENSEAVLRQFASRDNRASEILQKIKELVDD
jgi:hypothetical protein